MLSEKLLSPFVRFGALVDDAGLLFVIFFFFFFSGPFVRGDLLVQLYSLSCLLISTLI